MFTSLLKLLVASWAGRIVLSVIVQGFFLISALLWSEQLAKFALDKVVSILNKIGFLDALRSALAPLGSGDLPSFFVSMMSCSGFTPALVALISGQISGIGLAIICRKFL